MLIYVVSSLLLGVLHAARSATEAGCTLSYLQIACPAWLFDLRTAAARSRRLLARNLPRLFRRASKKRTLF